MQTFSQCIHTYVNTYILKTDRKVTLHSFSPQDVFYLLSIQILQYYIINLQHLVPWE